MAWRSHGRTNLELVQNLKHNGLFQHSRVEDAMLAVDRAKYCPRNPYEDSPQAIGFGQTISAPHMHASTLELLNERLQEGSRALDVGSGSGYLSACMAHMVGPTGRVFGIEYVPELVALSHQNIKRDPVGSAFVADGRLTILHGDGWKGLPDQGPFNAIHVGAAAVRIPEALVQQLAPGGRMVIPVGPQGGYQELVQVDRDAVTNEVHTKSLMGVMYVPLVRGDCVE
eukprot:Rmarinus@m.15029